jgi:hypothetical protein
VASLDRGAVRGAVFVDRSQERVTTLKSNPPLSRAIREALLVERDKREQGNNVGAAAAAEIVERLRDLAASADTDRLVVTKCPKCGAMVSVEREHHVIPRRRKTPPPE